MDGNANTKLTFTALFPFGGIAGGALGFQRASAALERLGIEASFKVLGGIDFDAGACAAFTSLTGAPCLCADVRDLASAQLVEAFGATAPDVVFFSPPCKGASGLISDEKAQTETYAAMNELALVWTRLMLATWATPPKLLLLENVPRIATRAKKMLDEVCKLLRKAGYVLHKGKHDCGEVGGLAQHRERFLMVARLQREVSTLLYQPPHKRVRGCGEVLGELPLPGAPSAGPLHALPRISMLNWLRLALIPAGGDWRDLAGVLADGQTRREGWGRYHVCTWSEAAPAVTGSGTNGAYAVADPTIASGLGGRWGVTSWSTPMPTVTGNTVLSGGRFTVADPRTGTAFHGAYGVSSWLSPSGAITTAEGPSMGRFTVADPRVGHAYPRTYGVMGWGEAFATVTSNTQTPGCGPFSVADPRFTADRYGMNFRITSWCAPSWTVTGSTDVQTGLMIVADPRLGADNPGRHTAKYAVTSWGAPARTVTGTDGRIGSGAPVVADPRLTCSPWVNGRAYGVLSWSDPSYTVTGSAQLDNGPWSIADGRAPVPPFGVPRIEAIASGEGVSVELAFWCLARVEPEPFFVRWYPHPTLFAWKDPPPWPVVIVADDGTWHRPITVLEAATLQGLPARVGDAPLTLPGRSAALWREWIGNMVPVGAAEAIARQMLLTLTHAAVGSFALSSGGGVWVRERAVSAETVCEGSA